MRNTELSFLNTWNVPYSRYNIYDDESPENHVNLKGSKEALESSESGNQTNSTTNSTKTTTSSKKIASPLYSYSLSTKETGNYLKGAINIPYDGIKSNNPYLSLLQEFSKENSSYLSYSDFVYLRDIGVNPVNRLMILRRFGYAPSYDLQQSIHKKTQIINKPISTVIGWVKADEDLFKMSFHEVWKEQSKWLHDLIREIINDQFGIDVGNIFPIPGWGQSVIFGFLNKLGYTDYDSNNLPIGDANLLRSGITRETESNGISSTMNLTLETTYELKYIKGVDPTVAFQGIINNLLIMGTEDMKFLFRGGANINNLIKFIDKPNIGNLVQLVQHLINEVIGALTDQIGKIRNNSYVRGQKNNLKTAGDKNDQTEKRIELQRAQANSTLVESGVQKGTYSYVNPNTKKTEYVTKNGKNNAQRTVDKIDSDDKSKSNKDAVANQTAFEKFNNITGSLLNAETLIGYIKGIVNSVLASTMARYKWPVKGAIAQATGMNLTPWHLTIGNPTAPIISLNQIKVDNVDIRLSGDLLYNDLPKYIHATISISNARPLGKQEILRSFGVRFKRDYCYDVKKTISFEEMIDTEKALSDSQASRNSSNTTPSTSSTQNDLKGITIIDNNDLTRQDITP